MHSHRVDVIADMSPGLISFTIFNMFEEFPMTLQDVVFLFIGKPFEFRNQQLTNHLQLSYQDTALRGFGDGDVKRQATVKKFIGLIYQSSHFIQYVGNQRQILFRRLPRRKFRRKTLNGFLGIEYFAVGQTHQLQLNGEGPSEQMRISFGDKSTTLRTHPDFDNAKSFEGPERIPGRESANAELLSQFRFGPQELPARDFSGEQSIANLINNLR